ncbi:MAG TPA: hypothetical protein RMG48_17255 [Myxococcales bacterium LLY-WYZ-16_1]|nr:hypothetical protein [Myxococcales bacterium LLY-WYZ-16_1]
MKSAATQVGLQNAKSLGRMGQVIRVFNPTDIEWKRLRQSEAREYRAYTAAGVALLLPVVAARRLMRTVLRTGSKDLHAGVSLLGETRGEVQKILAFVFMA